MNRLKVAGLVVGLAAGHAAGCAFAADFRYVRVGNGADAPAAASQAGFALMGGGADLDEAFRWLCNRAGGGDFLVLRATGNDEYNSYIQGLCHLNSVATLVIPSRTAASDAAVARIISHASGLFICGGDQANYINFWMETPVEGALNEAIRRGVPIGGTSAGLAVIGEWVYSAQGDKPDDPNLDSKSVLENRNKSRVTLVHGFLDIPILKGILTDTHFARRDRMGRLLVFLAHANEPDGKEVPPLGKPPVRGIGVDQGAAVLLNPDGHAKVVGRGGAWFIDRVENAFFADPIKPVELKGVTVHKVAPGHAFNVKSWTGESSDYVLSVHQGKLKSNQPGGAIY
jgi:cyanophycinase